MLKCQNVCNGCLTTASLRVYRAQPSVYLCVVAPATFMRECRARVSILHGMALIRHNHCWRWCWRVPAIEMQTNNLQHQQGLHRTTHECKYEHNGDLCTCTYVYVWRLATNKYSSDWSDSFKARWLSAAATYQTHALTAVYSNFALCSCAQRHSIRHTRTVTCRWASIRWAFNSNWCEISCANIIYCIC